MNNIPEEIKEYLSYDGVTGNLHWIKQLSHRTKLNSIAGTLDSGGYLQIGFKRKLYRAHRIAWYLKTGEQPPKEIDHIDTIKSNNYWDNLREANKSQNQHNKSKRKDNVSGYKGVSYYKPTNKWTAQITVNSKNYNLGYYLTPEEAYEAYCKSAKELHKEFNNVT